MMIDFIIEIIISNALSTIVAVFIIGLQFYFLTQTKKLRNTYSSFFEREREYAIVQADSSDSSCQYLASVGKYDSDLNNLIDQINCYIKKSKGTTDFAVIQNKVERFLNMRYEQSLDYISFPVQIGLMGTFAGVLLGIFMFLFNFDLGRDITDESIKSLMMGVMISMSTSLCGLILTTISNYKQTNAKLKIEKEKNDFYDFIQTELMPSINVSLVAAIGKLHHTVDHFEPAFNRVINRFQETFEMCTEVFGETFEKNVKAVADAVKVMGKNMDKVNDNIQAQKELIKVLKSDSVTTGMDRFVKASNRISNVLLSLDKFEEARRMMLAAAQESIKIQNSYSDSLQIPLEIAVRVNKLLDRISTFEENINALGIKLSDREILGNDVVNKLQEQIAAIGKKQQLVDHYLETTDEQLETTFKNQIAVINGLTATYGQAIEDHICNYETLMKNLSTDVQTRHQEFREAIEEKFSIEDICMEFSHLQKLNDIDSKLNKLSDILTKLENLNALQQNVSIVQAAIQTAVPSQEAINKNVASIKDLIKDIQKDTGGEKHIGIMGKFFGR